MNMNNAKTVTLIETDLEIRGEGKHPSPFRRVRQWWTLEGELVVEKDPLAVAVPLPEAEQAIQAILFNNFHDKVSVEELGQVTKRIMQQLQKH